MVASSLAEAGAHHLDRHRVGDEIARVHVALGLDTERGLLGEVGPEEVAGGDVRHVEPLGQPLGLSSLARTRRAYQYNAHSILHTLDANTNSADVSAGNRRNGAA